MWYSALKINIMDKNDTYSALVDVHGYHSLKIAMNMQLVLRTHCIFIRDLQFVVSQAHLPEHCMYHYNISGGGCRGAIPSVLTH